MSTSPLQRVFTNTGPREKVPPRSQRVREVVSSLTTSAGRGRKRSEPEVFSKAPARDKRMKADAKQKTEEAEAPAVETAEAGPEETEARTAKPAPRKRSTRKRPTTS